MGEVLLLLEKAFKEVAHGRLPPPDILKPLISKVCYGRPRFSSFFPMELCNCQLEDGAAVGQTVG